MNRKHELDNTKLVIQRLLKQTQQLSDSKERPAFSKPKARVICIASGKGGTGKSVLSYNIGFHYAQKGWRVTILDADMGLGNIHELSATSLNYNLIDLIDGRIDLADAILETPFGFCLVSGATSTALANLTYNDFQELVNQLRPLELTNDLILIDTAPGLSLQTTAYLHTLNEIIIVATPESASISTTLTVIESIVQSNDLALIGLIINQVPKKKVARSVFGQLYQTCLKQFNKELINYGLVRINSAVVDSVVRHQPVQILSPKSKVCRDIGWITDRIDWVGSKYIEQLTGPNSYFPLVF